MFSGLDPGDVSAQSFVTQIRLLNGALEEGDMMEIQCSIEAQNLPGHFFSMTWLRNNMEVAQIGPSGVLSVPNTYMNRVKNGELRIMKKAERVFVLTIQPVKADDQGMYQCIAVQEEKTESGSFNKAKKQLSHEETVHITTKGQTLFSLLLFYNIKENYFMYILQTTILNLYSSTNL